MQQEPTISETKIPEIELTYTPHVPPSELPTVLCSEHAYSLLLRTWDKAKLEFVEQFRVMVLNKANRVLGICTLSTGGTSRTVIDVKLLFATAILSNASAVIIAHNHPSGTLVASDSDTLITRQIAEIGKVLGIALLDHLIVTPEGFCSLKEKGVL